ncbi:peroxiredoxin [Candidatus Falkowbacteria bacterium CG10_big_fil_rev_8_21_14_0_10_39_11]|uniref:Alkyl hydroperoxide reductase C n=1 Tax=Candidatus Falkowbacteria bacterium CG10_big_fil_rev_8_21_14_0_10_39_11 TaxID=1974565 RepID=A0A2H0V4C1_9BACT|nr:MAG: peroxiredoxin [Candidatus Falkowbacteria bacterium CG10_big_fil_rev_8_21_14_0_10_39_11]
MEEERNAFSLINQELPDMTMKIYHEDKEKDIKLSDYRGKWLVLFFYPADFTFVCPTELEDMAGKYPTLQEMNTEVISVSTDTIFVHKAWHDKSEAIGKVTFPMGADPTGRLCRALGTYIPEEGLSLRGTFIVDPDGIIKAAEVHDNSIGRNADELVRKIQAAQYVAAHGGEACPAKWKPGEKTLTPGLDLVGKI